MTEVGYVAQRQKMLHTPALDALCIKKADSMNCHFQACYN